MEQVRALVFDVFGTVVDWRSGVARELAKFLPAVGRPDLDPFALADAWRRRYQPGMEECRTGRRPFTRLDVLHRENLEAMLADHGKAARGYADVRANTVPAFALGDYEWLLAFEAPELHRIVDLMRDLRATEARRHVREEVPFYTGPRVAVADLVTRLP